MRACATANAVFLGLVVSVFGFAACAGGSTPPEAPPAQATAAATAVATTTSAPVPTVVSVAEAAKKPAPRTPADCKELVSEITNEPPANGVPLNNAMTTKDAGGGDRLEPLTELIRSKRDGFRCCFDLYAKSHPGAAGAMKMHVELKPDGTVTNVSFLDTPNRVSAPEVESCMIDLAKGLTYPRSPSGKETKFTYPFDFKARR
ncbi:MAG: AgmX/PglI C-terminal domain-containing protein [Minicystis sp.]